MANSLGTLFSDIANAIRSKTGSTAKMSPNDFPIHINSIVVGSGGASGGEWKFASGTVTSTGSAMTIKHELGAVPDIVFVYMKRHSEDKNFFLAALQFSNAMIEAFNGAGKDNEKGLGFAMIENLGLATLTMREGADGAHTQFGEMYGQIRKADAVSFTVGGGTITPIPSDREVTWWAVSGIT